MGQKQKWVLAAIILLVLELLWAQDTTVARYMGVLVTAQPIPSFLSYGACLALRAVAMSLLFAWVVAGVTPIRYYKSRGGKAITAALVISILGEFLLVQFENLIFHSATNVLGTMNWLLFALAVLLCFALRLAVLLCILWAQLGALSLHMVFSARPSPLRVIGCFCFAVLVHVSLSGAVLTMSQSSESLVIFGFYFPPEILHNVYRPLCGVMYAALGLTALWYMRQLTEFDGDPVTEYEQRRREEEARIAKRAAPLSGEHRHFARLPHEPKPPEGNVGPQLPEERKPYVPLAQRQSKELAARRAVAKKGEPHHFARQPHAPKGPPEDSPDDE